MGPSTRGQPLNPIFFRLPIHGVALYPCGCKKYFAWPHFYLNNLTRSIHQEPLLVPHHNKLERDLVMLETFESPNFVQLYLPQKTCEYGYTMFLMCEIKGHSNWSSIYGQEKFYEHYCLAES